MFKFNEVFEKREVRQKELRDKISPDCKFHKTIAG